MSYNIENVLPNLQTALVQDLNAKMGNGMGKLKQAAINLSNDRIYNQPLPSKYAKRTGLYKKSFKIERLDTCKYELSNTTSYGVYVEYKHNYMIMNDAVFNNLNLLKEELLK